MTGGSKLQLAETVRGLVQSLGFSDLTLVGHDAGGMAAYSYLRQYDDVDRVVVMNTVIAGVDPWNEVVRNPYIWHFGLHAAAALPETLVQGHQAEYFDYFYDALSVDPARISPGCGPPTPPHTAAMPHSPPGSISIGHSPKTHGTTPLSPRPQRSTHQSCICEEMAKAATSLPTRRDSATPESRT